MQKNYSLIKSGSSVLLAFLFFFGGTVVIPSCKDKSKSSPDSISAAGSFNMKSLRLTREIAQVWVDSGWTNPANANRIKVLLLQFSSANTSSINANLQVIAWPGKNMMEVHNYSQLSEDPGAPVSITGNAIFGNNVCNLDSLNIIKADGTLSNFSYVLFKPRKTALGFVVYETVVFTDNLSVEKGETNPCPPCQYCNPPNCPIPEL